MLHSCDNPRCVNPNHLFLGTQKDNVHDCMDKGRLARGERSGMAKLTDAAVRAIRLSSLTQVELGKKYGVGQAQISEVIRRNAWRHV